jgi:hypothetical protein
MTASEIIYGGYRPGVIGTITGLHGPYYAENRGFDVGFEAQVGRELSGIPGMSMTEGIFSGRPGPGTVLPVPQP